MENSDKKNHLKDPEYIIAYAIALISICALVVSIKQTSIMSEQRALMHEQAKAAVWPRISLGVSKSHSQENDQVIDYKIYMSNAGVGPAIIKYVRVSFEENPVANWGKLFKKFKMSDSIPTYISNSNISQNIVRAGDVVRVLGLSDNLQLAQIFHEHSGKIRFEIFYESIYGDMWKYSKKAESETTEELEIIPDFSEDEEFRD
ncbi:MAG: hypothetical protein ABJP45_14930 [Cyclobacteriaceae bacterium]